MLYIDSNGNIKLNRGDSFKLPLFIDASKDIFNSIRMPILENDKITFYLLEGNNCLCRSLIKKEFTITDVNDNGDIIISFDSEDTKYLCPGIYFYEIKLSRIKDNKESIVTIVPRRKFVIIN